MSKKNPPKGTPIEGAMTGKEFKEFIAKKAQGEPVQVVSANALGTKGLEKLVEQRRQQREQT